MSERTNILPTVKVFELNGLPERKTIKSVFQKIKYKVIRPVMGMEVFLKSKRSAGMISKFTVIETVKNSNNDIVETVLIQNNTGDEHTLKIVNGEWKIIGQMDDRSVEFLSG